jgi:hypothetical protein
MNTSDCSWKLKYLTELRGFFLSIPVEHFFNLIGSDKNRVADLLPAKKPLLNPTADRSGRTAKRLGDLRYAKPWLQDGLTGGVDCAGPMRLHGRIALGRGRFDRRKPKRIMRGRFP